jgi:UDP-N-acetylglucosamine 1-carboxyvinyltransferase
MSRYIITGGQQLHGEVSIRGAKNASYKEIIASILSDKPTQLSNVPKISDIKITESIAKKFGSTIEYHGEHCLEISTPKITTSSVPVGTGEKSRTSFMFSAPLLVRTGTAIVPTPGGDKLGARPLDRLFDCFSKMGIKTEITDKLITLNTDKIKAVHYIFNKPSHTVTETVLMVATFANGQTILDNAAREPEIDDLIDMINSMGGQIKRDSKNPHRITINGVKSLSGTKHQIIPDRNEIVTFATAALATKGSINILHCDPKIIKTFTDTINKMGAQTIIGNDELTVSWTKPLKNIDIETGPEPGFMTDWQAVFSVLLTQTVGPSSIIERVYPSRFQHIDNLKKMGVKISFFNPKISNPQDYYQFNPESDKAEYFHGVKIYGPTQLKPANFTVNDLRAGASTVLAALTAPGTSIINGVEYIERGYEKLGERLSSLGANIEYIKT